MFVNKQWASNITIWETHNKLGYEILSVSFRPFYLPREFTGDSNSRLCPGT